MCRNPVPDLLASRVLQKCCVTAAGCSINKHKMDKNNDLGMMNSAGNTTSSTHTGVNGEPNGGYFPTSPSPTSFCSPQTYANYQNQLNNNPPSDREKLMSANLDSRVYSPSSFGPSPPNNVASSNDPSLNQNGYCAGGVSDGAHPSGGSENANQRVKLNVGGKIFETLLSTLQKAGDDSNLATVAKEAALKDLPMFIDRDPETFAILLNYLRTSQLLVPSWADFSTLQLLKLDAHFYGIHNTAYINSLDHFNILKKFNFSINIKMTVPEIVASEIKSMTEGSKRKEAESKWLNWYKEDMLAFGNVFKASSISSFNAHFIPPQCTSLKMAFVLWNTNCNKDHIALFMNDLSKLHYIEELEITEL